MKEIVVLSTADSMETALKIARALTEAREAACVNIVPGIQSFFFWEGRTQEASETLMICKSRQQILDRIIARVRDLHSYSVPEVLALPIAAGLTAYLQWVTDSTKQ